MNTKLLVPLDGSAEAETILPHVVQFARATHCPITLLHVLTDSERSQSSFWVATAPAELRREWETEALTHVHSYLTAVAARLRNEGLTVHTETQLGDDAATTILALASRASEPTLLALATHGRSGWQHWVLGSVASTILETASTPLLIACAAAPIQKVGDKQKIVILLTTVELPESAFTWILPFIEPSTTQLVLAPTLFGGHSNQEHIIHEAATRLATRFHECGLNPHVRTFSADPRDIVDTICAEEQVDLVVVAGDRQERELAATLVRRCHVSVLLVP